MRRTTPGPGRRRGRRLAGKTAFERRPCAGVGAAAARARHWVLEGVHRVTTPRALVELLPKVASATRARTRTRRDVERAASVSSGSAPTPAGGRRRLEYGHDRRRAPPPGAPSHDIVSRHDHGRRPPPPAGLLPDLSLLMCDPLLHLGFCHAMLDVLNKHFQNILHVSKTQSGSSRPPSSRLLPARVPVGPPHPPHRLPEGILVACWAGRGPSSRPAGLYFRTFESFLVALFILSSGLACIETAANPYVTVLGPGRRRAGSPSPRPSTPRLLLPDHRGLSSSGSTGAGDAVDFGTLLIPYVVLGCVVLVVFASSPSSSCPSSRPGDARRETTRRPTALPSPTSPTSCGHRHPVPLHRRPGRGERLRRQLHPRERHQRTRAEDVRRSPVRLVPRAHRRGDAERRPPTW